MTEVPTTWAVPVIRDCPRRGLCVTRAMQWSHRRSDTYRVAIPCFGNHRRYPAEGPLPGEDL